MKVKYSNFSVESGHELPITVENYFKHDMIVYFKGADFGQRLYRQELFMCQVEDLLSGDEDKAKQALTSVINNREYELNELKKYESKLQR